MRLRAGDVAVVTGAASGIGLALARAFLARGLRVVLSDVRPDELAVAAAGLAGEVHPVVADVRSDDGMAALAAAAQVAFGPVDIACLNAGVAPDPGPMWELPMSTWQWTLDVALLGVIHGIRAFVPGMVARERGHLMTTASVGGLVALPGMGPYSAAKHAVVGLSESLRAELDRVAPSVGVSVLCPGLVDTPLPTSTRQNAPSGAVTGPPVSMSSMAGPGRAILSADAVAALACEAIESGRLHVITHPDSAAAIRARVRTVLEDLPTDPTQVPYSI